LTRIAIIGAGLSGLVLAHRLKATASATVFEKSRGVSGRMSTRYTERYQFDHGAQFFVAKTDKFHSFLQAPIAQGVVARWDAVFVELNRSDILSRRIWDENFPHYVAVPGMSHLGKYLATDLDVRLRTRVADIVGTDNGWQLLSDTGHSLGEFDWIVSTTPPAQAAELLPASFCHLHRLKQTKMVGCYALLLGMQTPIRLPWQAALVLDADISWISVNSSKPGRSGGFSLLVHASNAWSEEHIEDDVNGVKHHLAQETSDQLGHDVTNADYCRVHRWRYANVEKQNSPVTYVDEERSLAACGDWCIQGRVEAAFTSATSLADRLESLL
jgi:predicted NAD/FAD-dependent oxidoreductase